MKKEIIKKEIYENDIDVIASRLQEVSDDSLRVRAEKTPTNQIKSLRINANFTKSYVPWTYTAQWLDKNFPGWSFELIGSCYQIKEQYIQIGRLTVYHKGMKRIIENVGQESTQYKKDKMGNVTKEEVTTMEYVKNTMTDAFKRCAALLGCTNDLYDLKELEGEPVEKIEISEGDIDDLLNYWFTIHDRLNERKLSLETFGKMINSLYTGQRTMEQILTTLSEMGN